MYTGSKCQLKRHEMGQNMALDRRDSSFFRFAKDLGVACWVPSAAKVAFWGKKINLLCYFFPQKSVFVYREGEIKNLWKWKWGGQSRVSSWGETGQCSSLLDTESHRLRAGILSKSFLSKSWGNGILLELLCFSSGTSPPPPCILNNNWQMQGKK